VGAAPTGVDIAEAALNRACAAHPDLDFRLAPIDGPLPFDDGSFDVVWTTEVIEHVADTARWLSEVRRVLVPRGRLLLTTPSHGRLRVALSGVEAFSDPLSDHLHLYTKGSLENLLAEFGFDEISVRTAGGPPLLRRLLLARARLSAASAMSTPVAAAPVRASSDVNRPSPQPRSRTRSPARTPACRCASRRSRSGATSCSGKRSHRSS
jgi:SAM-dependent methyltransferase